MPPRLETEQQPAIPDDIRCLAIAALLTGGIFTECRETYHMALEGFSYGRLTGLAFGAVTAVAGIRAFIKRKIELEE